jgi:hypothetical protein
VRLHFEVGGGAISQKERAETAKIQPMTYMRHGKAFRALFVQPGAAKARRRSVFSDRLLRLDFSVGASLAHGALSDQLRGARGRRSWRVAWHWPNQQDAGKNAWKAASQVFTSAGAFAAHPLGQSGDFIAITVVFDAAQL